MKYKPFNHADTKILIFFIFFFGFISGDWKLPKSLHFWILNFRFLFFIFWQNLAKDKEKKRLPLWLDDDDDDYYYYYYCYFLWSQWDVWSLNSLFSGGVWNSIIRIWSPTSPTKP
jgi:hypothetical protein